MSLFSKAPPTQYKYKEGDVVYHKADPRMTVWVVVYKETCYRSPSYFCVRMAKKGERVTQILTEQELKPINQEE